MKGILIGIQSFVMLMGSVAVALAEETTKGGGYGATAYVWFGLIAIIVAYGIYDTFFRPVD